MKAIAAILLWAMTSGVLADTAKPVTSDKDGKSYIYDSARKPYIDDRLMRLHAPTGFRSDAPETSSDTAQDKPMPEKSPAPKSPG